MSTITLFEILSNDERIIVLSLPEEHAFITWNQSNTFQRWEHDCFCRSCGNDNSWKETGILTLDTVVNIEGYFVRDYNDARQVALTWDAGGYDNV